jgi:hypothetical protein
VDPRRNWRGNRWNLFVITRANPSGVSTHFDSLRAMGLLPSTQGVKA